MTVGRSPLAESNSQRPTANGQLMNRDSIVYSVCSFLLGLILGSLLIGPRLAKSGGAPAIAAEGGGAPPSDETDEEGEVN